MFFIVVDFIIIKEGLKIERRLLLSSSKEESKEDLKEKIKRIRDDKVMRLITVAANVAGGFKMGFACDINVELKERY